MRLSTQFQANFNFFYEKTLSAQKLKSCKDQLTKQKQANKKQQKQRFFTHKNFQEGGNCVSLKK